MALVAALTEQWIEVDGRRTELLAGGDGAPLVFLHGGGIVEGFDCFEPITDRFRFVVPFNPGFAGTADEPPVEGLDALVAHYDALLDTLGLDQAVLFGHSLGGWVAASYAHAHPGRVERLVLACPFGLEVPGHPPAPLAKMSLDEVYAALTNDPTVFAGRIPSPIDDAFLAARAREGQAIGRLIPGPFDPSLPGKLAGLDMPALILWGTDDRITPVEHAAAWEALLPSAETAIFDARGHLLFHEDPAALRVAADFAAEST